ncbi:MAG: GNAT family N-acetyltransferase [Blastocatellia bacterium]|nr:GNAT family N-acetyltransferase [Blastocatellia bacterium]
MNLPLEIEQNTATVSNLCPQASGSLTVVSLTDEHKDEVLAFLAGRPIHTFGMAGFICTNGMVSDHNRGGFYACRDGKGRLEGVALIGHHTLFETDNEAAIAAFARLAQEYSAVHMLLGEQEKVERFWHYYAEGGQAARLFCRELLFELKWPAQLMEPVTGIRLATIEDLHLIMPIQAQSAFYESGINPLDADPEGFRKRCIRRIDKGQTWVWADKGKLLFKAEVMTDTPEVIYLEGIWVDCEERGKGYGLRCMSQLARDFLQRTESICLLVNGRNHEAQVFYQKAGYKLISCYDTIFLKKEAN